jgi:hypothetical protein
LEGGNGDVRDGVRQALEAHCDQLYPQWTK